MKKKAFTLVELLVTIAIIGVMAMLLTPVLGKAREGARRAQCANNLRQIGMGMTMYMDEHNFSFPPLSSGVNNYWYNIIAPYVSDANVWKCPNYKYYNAASSAYQSYGYNFYLRSNDINRIRASTKCILVTDSSPIIPDAGWFYIDLITPPGYRHSNGTNILFVDGHIAWYKKNSIPLNPSDPECNLWWNK